MSADSRLRLFCLWLIVFQNSSLILVTSYSRTLVPAYLPSVAVFLSELMKLAAVISLLAYETPGGASEAIRQCVSLVRDTPHETAQFAVPALCYTLQNNLWYHALSNLDPVTAAVTAAAAAARRARFPGGRDARRRPAPPSSPTAAQAPRCCTTPSAPQGEEGRRGDPAARRRGLLLDARGRPRDAWPPGA